MCGAVGQHLFFHCYFWKLSAFWGAKTYFFRKFSKTLLWSKKSKIFSSLSKGFFFWTFKAFLIMYYALSLQWIFLYLEFRVWSSDQAPFFTSFIVASQCSYHRLCWYPLGPPCCGGLCNSLHVNVLHQQNQVSEILETSSSSFFQ